MALRRARRFDVLPAVADVAGFDYGELVAAECAAADHAAEQCGDYTATWSALYPLRQALVRRLEELAELEPRVVDLVAVAASQPWTRYAGPGDLGRAEAELAGSAVTAAIYLTEDGCALRGPFAQLHPAPKEP